MADGGVSEALASASSATPEVAAATPALESAGAAGSQMGMIPSTAAAGAPNMGATSGLFPTVEGSGFALNPTGAAPPNPITGPLNAYAAGPPAPASPSWLDSAMKYYNDYNTGSHMGMGDVYKDYQNNGFGLKQAGYLGNMGSKFIPQQNTQAPPITMNTSYTPPTNEYLKRYRGY